MVCKICESEVDNRQFVAREMMFGMKDEFEYFECSACGCLQITDVPKEMEKYYPEEYYAHREGRVKNEKPLKKFIKRERAKWFFRNGGNVIGWFLTKVYKPKPIFGWLKDAGVKLNSSILDVGCGSRGLLLKLRHEGFVGTKLHGIDPYIEKDIFYKNGVKVFKKELKDVDEKFDFIMMHHSFEHMKDPFAVFQQIYRILNVFSRPRILPWYEKSLENLARYIIQVSFSLERMAPSDIFSFDPAKAWEF